MVLGEHLLESLGHILLQVGSSGASLVHVELSVGIVTVKVLMSVTSCLGGNLEVRVGGDEA